MHLKTTIKNSVCTYKNVCMCTVCIYVCKYVNINFYACMCVCKNAHNMYV